MHRTDTATLQTLATYGCFGAFAGMALIGWVVWLDVSSIGTMMENAQNTLLANLFMGGAMLKGALLGTMIGASRLSLNRQRTPSPATLPVVGTARV